MKRMPNPKAFVSLFVGAALLGAAVHFAHGYQLKRNADALLRQATRLEEDGKLNEAADALYRYVQFVPDDDAAYARYGLLVDKQAKSPKAIMRAFFVLEQVVRRNPDRSDVRRRLVSLAMTPGFDRFSEAFDHLQILLKGAPKDAELEEMAGRCEEGNRRYAQGVNWYARAVAHAPERVGCYVRQADLLRRHLDKPEQADAVMDQLVKANPESAGAHLERARYLQRLNRIDEAGKEIEQALRLTPRDVDVLLTAAAIALVKPGLDRDEAREQSRKHLLQGVAWHPKDGRLYEALARLELSADRRAQAIGWIQKLKPLSEAPDVLWALALLWIDVGEMNEAREAVERLGTLGFAPASLSYANAYIRVKESRWLEAIRAMESARPLLVRSPELTLRADLLLGHCYEQLGNLELQLAAYRHAVNVDPLSDEARLGLAAALGAIGRTDEALGEYRRLLPRRPGLRVAMLRLLLLRQAAAAPEQRTWAEIDELLDEAGKLSPEPVEVPVYRAEVQAMKEPGRLDKARAILEAARQKHQHEPALWIGLAIMMDRQGQSAQAQALLEQTAREQGDRVDFRLARARIIAQRKGAEAVKQLASLDQDLARFTPAEQGQLLDGMADLCFRIGENAAAESWWTRVAQMQPDNLRVRRQLLDLGIQAENAETVRRLAGEIRRIEGDDGVLWRYAEATHQVLLARQGQLHGLPEARTRVTEINTRRPNWSRAVLLQAQIEELQDHPDQALEGYLKAIDLGEQHPILIRRAVQLLFGRRRFAEADQILRRLQESNSGDFSRMAAEISLLNRDQERALALASKAVSADSKDYRDHLWLGQMLSAAKDPKAEESLRRAVQVGPEAPEAWIALVQFLAGQNQRAKAEAVIAEAQTRLPPAERALTLAYCYESVGHVEKADQQFRISLQAKPNDAATLQAVANFHLRRGEVSKAEPLLRKLMAPDTKASAAEEAAARRTLALALISGGGYRRSQEALELVNRNLAARKNTEDLRAKAVVLASQAATRREAIRIYEDLVNRQAATVSDQFTLAQLYDLEGNPRRASEAMINILAAHGDNPVYVAYYAGSLLRRQSPDQAEVWVEKLEKLRPNVWRTVELRAQVLKAKGQADQAVPMVEKFAESPEANLALVAQLLEDLGEPAKAENFYRKLAASGKTPDGALLLALFLGRRQRTSEALDLCEQAWRTSKPEAVADAVVVLVYAAPDGEKHHARASEQLAAARKNHPLSQAIAFQLANLWDLQGKSAEAETLYREILTKNQDSTGALNNLAWLLALRREKLPEALSLINRAIEIGGPDPGLFDTRAAVYTAMGNAEAAIKDLEASLAKAGSASGYFHLARAYALAQNQKAAKEAWNKAVAAGLNQRALHRLERSAFTQLASEFNRK